MARLDHMEKLRNELKQAEKDKFNAGGVASASALVLVVFGAGLGLDAWDDGNLYIKRASQVIVGMSAITIAKALFWDHRIASQKIAQLNALLNKEGAMLELQLKSLDKAFASYEKLMSL